MDWSPDGSKLAVASADEVGLRIWDIVSGQVLISAQIPGQGVTSVRWYPDGTRLADTSVSTGIGIISASTGQTLSLAPIGGTSIDWSPDGTKLVSGSGYENLVYVADMVAGQQLMALSGHTAGISTVDWSPDGSKLASGSSDNTVRIWNAVTGASIFTLTGHTALVTEVAWSPDSTQLASASDDGTVRIWDITTGQQVSVIQGNGRIYTVDWSPDGSNLAYGGIAGTVEIIPAPGAPTPTPTPSGSAFPSTGVLDDFNRADGSLGSHWSGSTSGYAIAGSQLSVTEDDGRNH